MREILISFNIRAANAKIRDALRDTVNAFKQMFPVAKIVNARIGKS